MGLIRKFVATAISGLLLSVGLSDVASADPSIIDVRLDIQNPKIGDVVNWLVDVDCSGLPIQQVIMYVQDPTGVQGWLTNSFRDIKSGALGTKATLKIPFKITDEASAGTYKVQSVTMTCQRKSGGEYRWSGSLDSISFDLKTGSSTPSSTQPRIEKLEVKSSAEVKVGEKILINLLAVSMGKLNTANLTLRAPNGVEIQKSFSQYGQTLSGEASKRIETTFEFDVNEDWVPGIYKISQLVIEGYAGIDLSNPEPDDPNPRNTTSSFNRSVVLNLSPSGIESTYGSPVAGGVAQPSLKTFSVTVNNPNPTEVLPPEVTKASLPTTATAAGDNFNFSMSVDAKNAYIFNAYATFSLIDNPTKTFGCGAEELRASPPQKIIENLMMKCRTQRTNSAGSYVLSSITVNSTTCSVSPNFIYNEENQGCTQAPRARYSNYYYQNNYGYVISNPVIKKSLINVLDGKQKMDLLPAAPLQAPKYTSAVIESTQIKISYPWTYEYSCDYTPSSGRVSSGTNDKIYNVVTITELEPSSKVVLSGTCTADDKSKVSFTEVFTTALPKPPVLPTVIDQKSDYDSVIIILSDLDQAGIEYDIEVTSGSFIIAGDTLEISDLEPGESSILTMTMTDSFGQSTSGIVGTFKAQNPPKLMAPTVTVVKSSKGNYIFTFKRVKDLSYAVKAINCSATLSGDNIFISGLVPKKLATAFLNVSDKYRQKVSVKFFTAFVKK